MRLFDRIVDQITDKVIARVTEQVTAKVIADLANQYMGGILTGTEIIRQVKEERLFISEFDEKRVNPVSYNVRAGESVSILTGVSFIDMHDPSSYEGRYITYKLDSTKGFMCRPGISYLIPIRERIYSPVFEPILTGRSSCGRLGVRPHEEAGFGDIGYDGHLCMQLKVTIPTRIYAGDPLTQLYFLTPYGSTEMQYNGKYQKTDEIVSKWKGTEE